MIPGGLLKYSSGKLLELMGYLINQETGQHKPMDHRDGSLVALQTPGIHETGITVECHQKTAVHSSV